MNILIVKTSAIGDVLHTLPALACLRRQYPSAHISWLVEEAAADIVLSHPLLDQVIISRRKQWIQGFFAGNIFGTLKEIFVFIKKIRIIRYDLLLDFQGLLKSGILIACCRAVRKVGFGPGMEHSEGSYIFLNERIPPVDMNIHAVDRELLLLQAIGISCGDVDYRLYLAEQHLTRAKKLLTGHGLNLSQPFVAINPMTTWPTKHWTDTGFALLADALIAQGLGVVFTGGTGDREAISSICSLMRLGKGINVSGETDLKTLAALFSLSICVVSTDTGPMHLAAAVQAPVVALFGPTAPWRTGPYGNFHEIVRTDIDCSPCLKKDCRFGNNKCMIGIDVNSVIFSVNKILKNIDKGCSGD